MALITETKPPACDSTQVLTTLSPPALTPESDLPIALRKGMCSTRNPSPHYITELSSIVITFLYMSFLSFFYDHSKNCL